MAGEMMAGPNSGAKECQNGSLIRISIQGAPDLFCAIP